jgi:hypothetical protein
LDREMCDHIHINIFEHVIIPKHLMKEKCYIDVDNIIPQTQQKTNGELHKS